MKNEMIDVKNEIKNEMKNEMKVMKEELIKLIMEINKNYDAKGTNNDNSGYINFIIKIILNNLINLNNL